MEVGKLTFTELFELFGSSNARLKFSVEQGAVKMGVDNGGTLLVKTK